MPRIADFTYRDVLSLQDKVRDSLRPCEHLQQAAQTLTDCVWEAWRESTVLVRCFATVPYRVLPVRDQQFVQILVQSKEMTSLGTDETPILSLLGTRGVHSSWNRREDSKGHLGIPLLSSEFVQSIPMVARLLFEIGVPLQWPGEPNSNAGVSLGAGQVGAFYVREAALERDHQNRAVISAQEFVHKWDVQTVFGLGGVYGSGTALVLLVFTHDLLEREQIEAFRHLVVTTKAATNALVQAGAFYGEQSTE